MCVCRVFVPRMQSLFFLGAAQTFPCHVAKLRPKCRNSSQAFLYFFPHSRKTHSSRGLTCFPSAVIVQLGPKCIAHAYHTKLSSAIVFQAKCEWKKSRAILQSIFRSTISHFSSARVKVSRTVEISSKAGDGLTKPDPMSSFLHRKRRRIWKYIKAGA